MGIGKAEKSILLQYSLYCSSLEPNLQYLQGMSVLGKPNGEEKR